MSPWQSAKLPRIAKEDFSAEFVARSPASKTCTWPSRPPAMTSDSASLPRLEDEWQQVVDDGLGDQDITVSDVGAREVGKGQANLRVRHRPLGSRRGKVPDGAGAPHLDRRVALGRDRCR